jgi:hypothetical protein
MRYHYPLARLPRDPGLLRRIDAAAERLSAKLQTVAPRTIGLSPYTERCNTSPPRCST